jgi:hypothetical protein
MLWNEWKDLELQIEAMNDEVERIASSDAACMRLRQIPGIGPLVATAIVAAIGNIDADFSSFETFPLHSHGGPYISPTSTPGSLSRNPTSVRTAELAAKPGGLNRSVQHHLI